MQTIKVNSVSEYIKILESLGIDNYIYRGQNEPYYGIQANGFRPYLGGWDTDKIYNIDKIVKDYYQQIVSKLKNEEKQHFLAFCQHYGIPTNLIDFSYSPLIALFFACQGKREPTFSLSELIGNTSVQELERDSSIQDMLIHNLMNKLRKPMLSKYAQVYLLNKKWLLDITDVISTVEYGNFLESIYDSKEIRLQLIYKLQNLFENPLIKTSEISDCLIQLIECYRENDSTFWGGFLDDEDCEEEDLFLYQRRLKNEALEDVILPLYCFVFNEMEDERIPYEANIFGGYPEHGNIYQLSSATYIFLLANLIQIFHNDRRGFDKLKFKLKIYFTYQPPNLFDRISMQKGVFVYQPYFYAHDIIFNYNMLSVQNIIPDIHIEINNYQEILSELDTLGINLGSVYGDLDNIAKSVVYSYKRRNKV